VKRIVLSALLLSGCAANRMQLEWPGQTYMIEAEKGGCVIYNPFYVNLSKEVQGFYGTFIMLDSSDNTLETRRISCDAALPSKASSCGGSWELSVVACTRMHSIKMATQRN